MAEYKGIHGTKIQNYTSDPDNPLVGQVWYNETTNGLKYEYQSTTSAWSTGGNLNTARRLLGGCGTQIAALAFGGGGNPDSTAITESYNGTNWTEVNNLTTARGYLTGCGTNTAALAFGGNVTPNSVQSLTETWNGTNWAAVNTLNVARRSLGAAGTNTAALAFGGNGTPPTLAATEEFTDPGTIIKTITTS